MCPTVDQQGLDEVLGESGFQVESYRDPFVHIRLILFLQAYHELNFLLKQL